jgi:hypothetical protein
LLSGVEDAGKTFCPLGHTLEMVSKRLAHALTVAVGTVCPKSQVVHRLALLIICDTSKYPMQLLMSVYSASKANAINFLQSSLQFSSDNVRGVAYIIRIES